jgi:hypothetical protein
MLLKHLNPGNNSAAKNYEVYPTVLHASPPCRHSKLRHPLPQNKTSAP